MNSKLKFQIYDKIGSQAQFSQLVGLDESAVSRVIHERRELKEEQKKRWAEILGCDVTELFPQNGCSEKDRGTAILQS